MKRLLLTYLFLLFSSFIYSQVGINTNSPDPSSALDIQSTNGGILIPRLTQDQRDAIAYPATGLLIFQTNESAGFYFYNGEQWTRIEGAGFEQSSEAAAEGITEVIAGYGLSGGGNTGQVTLDIDFTTFSTVMPGLTDYVVGFDQTGESLIRISDILALAPEGNPGPVGPQGPAGLQGEQGVRGDDGVDGALGPQGAQGPQGVAGTDGTNGIDGAQGPQGEQGPAGPAGPTGPQGPQGVAGTEGTDGVDGTNGLSAYETWLNLGNSGTEQDFIDSLTGPQGPQGPTGGAGSSAPTLQNFIIYDTVGVLTDWTVPVGTSILEIFMTSSKGGDGGNCTSTNGGIYQSGGNGGAAGYLSLKLSVQEGQIISFRIGENGVDGADYVSNFQNGGYGQHGTQGEPTELYLDGNQVIFLNGGEGGQGGHCISSNVQADGDSGATGNIGTLYQDWFSSGAFDITHENIINLDSQKLIIRY
jgi:hypothetical protein